MNSLHKGWLSNAARVRNCLEFSVEDKGSAIAFSLVSNTTPGGTVTALDI
jgi:hypothetical protein